MLQEIVVLNVVKTAYIIMLPSAPVFFGFLCPTGVSPEIALHFLSHASPCKL